MIYYGHLGKDLISENAINNNSLVAKLIYKDFSMLFTGDIEEVAEKAILKKYEKHLEKLKATVLKVPHHGSKTSSTQEFLNAVNPRVALIGVGKNNTFGHPNSDVLERLKKSGIKLFRTDEDGEINVALGTFLSRHFYVKQKKLYKFNKSSKH